MFGLLVELSWGLILTAVIIGVIFEVQKNDHRTQLSASYKGVLRQADCIMLLTERTED